MVLIVLVKVYYHLNCQENADISGDIENTPSMDFMAENQDKNPFNRDQNEPFPM